MFSNIFQRSFLKKRENFIEKSFVFRRKNLLPLLVLTILLFFCMKTIFSKYTYNKPNDYIIQNTENNIQNTNSIEKNKNKYKDKKINRKIEEFQKNSDNTQNMNHILIKIPDFSSIGGKSTQKKTDDIIEKDSTLHNKEISTKISENTYAHKDVNEVIEETSKRVQERGQCVQKLMEGLLPGS